MKLVADESVEGPTVERLRGDGHLVLFIAETAPGIADYEVIAIARREKTLLLTADKDFGELVFRHGLPHYGILLIRSKDGDADVTAENVTAAVGEFGPELLDRFSVLAGRALRVRRR